MFSHSKFTDPSGELFEHPFPDNYSPYESNGGTILAIAGDDFVLIAGDTRLSSDLHIHTRTQSKLFEVNPLTVLGSTGCWSDTLGFIGLIKTETALYKHAHRKNMSVEAMAQLLSNNMYNRRFFPYYLSNILAGIDSKGAGAVYSYDPIGHVERMPFVASGTGGRMVLPVLDNQIGLNNLNLRPEEIPILNRERAMHVASEAFHSAAERDIYTGDSVEFNIITKDGIEAKTMTLRDD